MMELTNDWENEKNLTMLTDFYEFTMAGGYFRLGLKDQTAVFDMFFRRVPDDGGFAIFAGLEQIVRFLSNLKFTDDDISYFRKKGIFSDEFLKYLADFKFSCDVWCVPEGSIIFPGEPIVTVKGPIIEAQLVETMILLTINHQSLIATKANRVVRAARNNAVVEFGSRRAQSYDAAVLGARASYIGGCMGTACTMADRDYKIPASGTMAHSWVQLFDTEYEAFCSYSTMYPYDCTLLVDTYSVLRSGVPNAIKAFDEVVVPMGFRPKAIRIDSGDIAYLSKKARKMLDEAGYSDVKIIASNSLDEYIIRDLLTQGAQVDVFGVGENLITSKSDPVFGGVYKLVAIEKDGEYVPRIKISETLEKITTPGFKTLYRFYDKTNGKAIADYIALFDEKVEGDYLEIFDPIQTWKTQVLENFEVRRMMVQIFKEGELIYELPNLEDIRSYCMKELNSIWDEVKRFEHPHRYYVDMSRKLWDVRHNLLQKASHQ